VEKDIVAEAKDAFKDCEEAERNNRDLGMEDLKFSMGDQWPSYAKNMRGEDRPMLTLNRIPSFIRQVTNDARQNKPSIKCHPVDSGADPHTAKILDGLIRNIEYTSRADTAYDTAIDFAARIGWGYIGVDLDYACDDTFDLDIKIRRISDPFSIYGDPSDKEADSANWNTAFEVENLTIAEFMAAYPNAEKTDWEAVTKDSDLWFDGKEIRIARWWRREKVMKKLLLLSDGKAMFEEAFIKPDPETGISMQMIAESSGVQVVQKREAETHKVTKFILNGREVLNDKSDQIWIGKYIPLIPVYGEEIVVDGKRVLKSLHRDARDAQMMFNFWRTASTELVALAPKAPWIGPEGFAKKDSKWETANTGNHQYLEYFGSQPPQRISFAGIPAGHLQEAMNASEDLKSIMGLFDASLGAKSNETSGKAIMARQREGDVSTFHFQDNMTRAIRQVGAVVLDLIPKVYSERRILRVIGEDGTASTVPHKQQYEIAKGQMAIHDLAAGKYDITVKAGPSFTTRREEAAMQMTEIMRAMPESAPIIGPHFAKNLDWPGADEIAEDLKLISPVNQIKKQQEMEAAGVPPPPDPEVVKQEKQLELEERKSNNDIMLSREKMNLQQQQAQLDAQIKIATHQMDMEMMGQKHSMTMQQSKEKMAMDMHGKTVEAFQQPEGEDMPKNPLVNLLEQFMQGIGQMVQTQNAMAQNVGQLAGAVAQTAMMPKEITMLTSQGKQLKASVQPVMPEPLGNA
jgi:hypothetical protein